MEMIDCTVEDLIPQRDRMKLLDEIIEVDAKKAVTVSTATKKWPLYDNNAVNPIILIELVAQTAGICIGWNEKKVSGKESAGKGWLVGVEKADFFLNKIPLKIPIITSSTIKFRLDKYAKIVGYVKIGSKCVGEIVLQVVSSD